MGASSYPRPALPPPRIPYREAIFAQAIAAGAQVRQPVQEMFRGDLLGQLDDPFGHRWNISQHLRDLPHEEVLAAAALAVQ